MPSMVFGIVKYLESHDRCGVTKYPAHLVNRCYKTFPYFRAGDHRFADFHDCSNHSPWESFTPPLSPSNIISSCCVSRSIPSILFTVKNNLSRYLVDGRQTWNFKWSTIKMTRNREESEQCFVIEINRWKKKVEKFGRKKLDGKAKRKRMRLWILERNNLIVLAIFTFTLYVYFNYTLDDIIHFKRIIAGDTRVTNTTKKILFWNTMFDDENFYMGKGDIFVDCPVNDCYATHERSYANLTEFDAVLFHGNELRLADLPLRRSPRQWYVFVNLESPANRPLSDYFYEDFFNATMTYRLDSDIVWTYGIVKDVHNGQTVAPDRDARWRAFYNRAGNVGQRKIDFSISKDIGIFGIRAIFWKLLGNRSSKCSIRDRKIFDKMSGIFVRNWNCTGVSSDGGMKQKSILLKISKEVRINKAWPCFFIMQCRNNPRARRYVQRN